MTRFSDEYLAFLAGTSGVHSMQLTGDDAKLSHAVDKPRIFAAEIITLRARVAELEASARADAITVRLDALRQANRAGAEAMRSRAATWLRGLLGSVIGEAIVARAAALPLDADAGEESDHE